MDRIICGGKKSPLAEFPVLPASDTWFGPPTEDGELGYSSTTHCRIRLDDYPFRIYRATTAVTIVNKSKSIMPVQRIKLPVINLALYSGKDGRLWKIGRAHV